MLEITTQIFRQQVEINAMLVKQIELAISNIDDGNNSAAYRKLKNALKKIGEIANNKNIIYESWLQNYYVKIEILDENYELKIIEVEAFRMDSSNNYYFLSNEELPLPKVGDFYQGSPLNIKIVD